MSDTLQFEAGHPDADQLTAFAEHVLPAHERQQMLAHLAACARCRGVVLLAQEEVAEAPETVVSLPRPWFAGWKLWVPAGFAAAAMLALTFSLTRQKQLPAARPPVTALDVPPPVAAPLFVAPHAFPLPPTPLPNVKPAIASRATQPGSADKIAPEVVRPPQATPALNNFLASSSSNAAPAPQAGQVASGRAASSGDLVTLNQAQMTAASPPPSSQPPPAPLVVGAAPQALHVSASGPSQQAQQYVGGEVSSQTVQVSAASAGLLTTNAELSTENRTLSLLPSFSLPSRLAVRSTASSGLRMIAVDQAGSLFASMDAGQHWRSVPAKWQGSVRQVALAGSPAQPVFERKMRVFTATAPLAQPDAAGVPATGVELVGLISDPSGAVVPGATVGVIAVDGRTVASTQADRNGQYRLTGFAPGRYRVQVASPGFTSYTRDLTLQAGARVTLPAVLQSGAVSESVTVESNAALLDEADAKPALFQLTTDTGQTWTSTDGEKWKRQP